MEKIISITIGKIVFNVEEDAYEKLSSYLGSIKAHFKKDNEREEILEDIEISIAEKLLARQKNKDMAVTVKDVETIIKKMGKVEDFGNDEVDEEEAESDKSSDEKSLRRLYRNPDDKMIAGVCSGIAAYFGLDPVIVRLVFLVSIFFGGVGVVAYVILWIITPEAVTTGQKLEMHGTSVTLHQIEKSIKNGIDKIKKKDFKVTDQFEKGFNKVFSIVGKIVMVVLAFVRVVAGIALTVSGISGVFILSFGTAWIVSGGHIPFAMDNYVPIDIRDFITVGNVLLWFLIGAIYILVLVPFLILFTAGVSLLKKRIITKPYLVIILLALWFASLGLIASVAIQNTPQIKAQVEKMEGNELSVISEPIM